MNGRPALPLALLAGALGLLAGPAAAAERPGTAARASTAAPTTRAPTPKPTTHAAPKPPTRPGPPPLVVEHWLNSGPLVLDQLKGKVVVVHFWGVVNGPSRRLMPQLATLLAGHKDGGLVLIGVTEDAKADVEAFAKRHKIAYPLALDAKGATSKAYGVEFLPTVWVIARDGAVAWKGYAEKFRDAIVLKALGDAAPPPAGKPGAPEPHPAPPKPD